MGVCTHAHVPACKRWGTPKLAISDRLSSLTNTEVTSTCSYAQLLLESWGFELRTSYWSSKLLSLTEVLFPDLDRPEPRAEPNMTVK